MTRYGGVSAASDFVTMRNSHLVLPCGREGWPERCRVLAFAGIPITQLTSSDTRRRATRILPVACEFRIAVIQHDFRKRLKIRDDASSRIIEDLIDLAGFQGRKNVGEVFASISRRCLRCNSVRGILSHHETKIVSLQLVVRFLKSPCFAVLALPFATDSLWYPSHHHEIAFAGGLDHDFRVDADLSTAGVGESH